MFKSPVPERRVGFKTSTYPLVGISSQCYDRLKVVCQVEGSLFEDEVFPSDDSSIFGNMEHDDIYQWKRPQEICGQPKWIISDGSRFDVSQGILSDYWVLASMAALTCNQKMFNHVVGPNQSFSFNYHGIFKFNFWFEGYWQEVVVDDRLPTKHNKLVFMGSRNKNEFWCALMEKAYAKLNGSYKALEHGTKCESMEDFTGGVVEKIDICSAPPNLFQLMQKARQRGSLMTCSINDEPGSAEGRLSNGLLCGQTYSVTSVLMIRTKPLGDQGCLSMVRIRNLWGSHAEWKGAWSDGSAEMCMISDDEKVDIGLTFEDDGEFWMTFTDFKCNFRTLHICYLHSVSTEQEDPQNNEKWETFKAHGSWIQRMNAGGSYKYTDTFWTNPQFTMTLTEPDDRDGENLCTAIVAILQKGRRLKHLDGLTGLVIGYAIYEATDVPGIGPFGLEFFKHHPPVAAPLYFTTEREIIGRHRLPLGTYVVVPSVSRPYIEGDFLLRIFTEKVNYCMELDEVTLMVDNTDRPQPTPQDEFQCEILQQSFRHIAGKLMVVDAYQLQEVLNSVFTKEFAFSGFGIECVRSMVAMLDDNISGRINYEEFKALWEGLAHWRTVFKEFDRDRSGNLPSCDLRKALHHIGYRISNQTFKSLVFRFSNNRNKIGFEDFITCSVRLKTMMTSYRKHDPKKTGVAVYSIDNFIQTTLYS